MFLVDAILKPVDSYWRTRYHAEEIRANKATADLRYSEGVRREQERDLAALSERDVKQARAISAFTREAEELKAETERLHEVLREREREIDTLREALRSERTARDALKTNARLWEKIKGEASERAHV